MAKFERYEPRQDAGRVFDGGELEDEDEEGSRLPLLLVIGLLVVGAFAGVVWLAYTQGVQRGRADAPRMLVAANGPVKEAPSDPGGAETPYKGLKIYQQPAPTDEDDTEAAPQPPTAKIPAAKAPAAKALAVAPPAVLKPQEMAQTPPPPAKVPPTRPAQAAASDDQNAPASPTIATRPPRSLHGEPKAAATSAPAAPPAKAKPVPASLPSTAEEAPAASGGSAVLQIGAYKSQEEADAAWTSFSHKHPIAAAYHSDVKKVDLGDKGTWYRLRLGSFADRAAASSFCDRLKADGGNCFLAR